MWDWGHFKDEGWLAHSKRSAGLAALLLLSGAAMIPFWQQPEWLQRRGVARALCEGLESTED